jgi:N-ethylmaleimide reductase
MEYNQDLSQSLNTELFYSADEKGYTDYPFYKAPLVPEIEQG